MMLGLRRRQLGGEALGSVKDGVGVVGRGDARDEDGAAAGEVEA